MKIKKTLLVGLLASMLSSCGTLFDKDNTPAPTPLTNFTPEISVQQNWYTKTGTGVGSQYLKLVPTIDNGMVFTASKDGTVTAVDQFTGKRRWTVNSGISVTGGPGAGSNIVVVGGSEGEVVALDQSCGAILWKVVAANEILAAPAISQDVVLAKTIDGKLLALSAKDGHTLWNYQQTEPLLILRGSSAPKIFHNNAIVGFANGNLAKFDLRSGNLHWQEAIAIPEGSFAIQRMIDVDADPIIHNGHIYAATYQGRISAIDSGSGKAYWSYDLSTYTGLAADRERVYVSDAKGHVWAFDASSGKVDWRMKELEYRNVTGPAEIGNYVVVADEEGYLHWLCKDDGRLVARVRVSSAGFLASPVVSNNIVYVYAKNGALAAYSVR